MISTIILQLLALFKLALFIRLIVDYIRIFAKSWRPKGLLLAFFEFIYTLTDPAMKFVGRFVPPLRIGGVALDLSFIVLIIAIGFLESLIKAFLSGI
jgi:YggT family protein